MRSGESWRQRAAASSMANGMPSTRRQIRTLASSSASVTTSWGRARQAAIPEQCQGAEGVDVVEARCLQRCRERCHAPGDLAADAQRLAARGDDRDAGATGQHGLHHYRTPLRDVLAVVEDHEECCLRFEHRDELIERRGHRRLRSADSSEHRRSDRVGIVDGGEIDPPNPARVVVGGVGGDLQCQPGLADATGPRERDQASPRQQRNHRGDVVVTAQQRRRLQGKVVPTCGERTKSREARPEPWRNDLVDVLGGVQVLEPVRPERGERHAVGKVRADQRRGSVGDHDLFAVRATLVDAARSG